MERSTRYTPKAPSTHMTPHINVGYMTNQQRDRPGRFVSIGDGVHMDSRMHPKVLIAQKNYARKSGARLTKRQMQ